MRPSIYVALFALALVGCSGTATATLTALPIETLTPTVAPTSTPSPTPTPTLAPTASPSPTPTASPAAASPWPACINGWLNPAEGTPEREEGITILMNYMGLTDPVIVDDMRYFIGPDPPNIIEPRFEAVEHWYIKATLSTDPTYRGRWLVEKRDETTLGVSAVAPYDTVGYTSPDWHGFVGDGLPRPIEGLPGLWGGIDYDFVTGENDGGFPGIDESISECLTDT